MAKKSKVRRGLLIGAQMILGLGLGLGIAEYAFGSRAEWAFPHVNFYVPDAELGVRLEPGATMQFKLRGNPRTTIHVNSRGFRGADWPAPAEGEVIVVGDSQVFGLGVDDDATFSARLASKRGVTVLNAGVPTYGPDEYLATARELLAERKARTVVVALNFVNDPFEIDRPNRERHAVWDGWAVRSETAPATVSEFPGRRWLFSRSHAVYALRRWLHARGSASAPEAAELGDPLDLGTPSEGGLHDLVLASQKAHADVARVEQTEAEALASAKTRLAGIDKEIRERRDKLDTLVVRASEGEFDYFERQIARGQPGDIVDDGGSEASRSVQLTAAMIRGAARERDKYLQELLKEQAKKGKGEAATLVKEEGALIAERRLLRERVAAGAVSIERPPSFFRGYLQRFKALCDEHGAELVVVALPIDVQVDRGEWAKYGVADGPDMSESRVLIDDLVADARGLGLRALDATEALRGAEPGAFLDHDIHMTAKGHAALADALAAALDAAVEAPLRAPNPGLPEGRSFAPGAGEWAIEDEVLVKGSTAAGCTTQIRREWLRVQCRRQKVRDGFVSVEVREGATPATMAMRTPDALSLVTPMTIGAPITARFTWKAATRDLEIRWPAGEDGKPRFVGTFVDVPAGPQAQAPLPPVAATAKAVEGLCVCHRERTSETFCTDPGTGDYDSEPTGCQDACGFLWGDPRLAEPCERAFPGDCDRRLACVQNDPLSAPTCPDGHVHAFASNGCFALCDEKRPCASGACTPWQGASVCVG